MWPNVQFVLTISKYSTYFGQTVNPFRIRPGRNPFHIRMNEHPSHFKIGNSLSFGKSAIYKHAFLCHKDYFSMNIYKLGVVKKVSPFKILTVRKDFTLLNLELEVEIIFLASREW